METNLKKVEWILRIAVFGTFLGHGYFALQIKQSWIPYLTNVGFNETTATTLLPIIGIIDIIIAISALVKPVKIALIWGSIWALSAQIAAMFAGKSYWDFIEHFAYWATPLALLMLYGLPKNFKEILKK